jgi:glycosyltransferase involved in cell wall biosynthesis
MKPLLSVLIPSIPSRLETFMVPLYDYICEQVQALPDPSQVEVLCVVDNKRRSIGYKRQALLDIARGTYVCWIDDDDRVSEDYIASLVEGCSTGADVVTFRQWVIMNNSQPMPLTFKHGYPVNDPPHPNGFTRPPWHVCPWKRTLAEQGKYPDSMYGEDWEYLQQIIPLAKTSTHIDKFLCTYIYNDSITEAK